MVARSWIRSVAVSEQGPGGLLRHIPKRERCNISCSCAIGYERRADSAIGRRFALGHGSNRSVGVCQRTIDMIKQELEEFGGVSLKLFAGGALVVQFMDERDCNKQESLLRGSTKRRGGDLPKACVDAGCQTMQFLF